MDAERGVDGGGAGSEQNSRVGLTPNFLLLPTVPPVCCLVAATGSSQQLGTYAGHTPSPAPAQRGQYALAAISGLVGRGGDGRVGHDRGGRLAGLPGVVDEGRESCAAPLGLGNLLNAYNAANGTLDVRIDVNELAQAPAELLCTLIDRSTPGSLPQALRSACGNLANVLDGGGKLPSVADLLSLLQGDGLPSGTTGSGTTKGGAR